MSVEGVGEDVVSVVAYFGNNRSVGGDGVSVEGVGMCVGVWGRCEDKYKGWGCGGR